MSSEFIWFFYGLGLLAYFLWVSFSDFDIEDELILNILGTVVWIAGSLVIGSFI